MVGHSTPKGVVVLVEGIWPYPLHPPQYPFQSFKLHEGWGGRLSQELRYWSTFTCFPELLSGLEACLLCCAWLSWFCVVCPEKLTCLNSLKTR